MREKPLSARIRVFRILLSVIVLVTIGIWVVSLILARSSAETEPIFDASATLEPFTDIFSRPVFDAE